MPISTSIKNALLIIGGCIALLLGVIGIVLPLLPTTPFLLLAGFCFIKSSKTLYEWLVNHRILGRYIKSYIIHKAIDRRTKLLAIGVLWLSLGISLFLIRVRLIELVLVLIGLGVSAYILSLKTLTE